jgi:hypothetical protein
MDGAVMDGFELCAIVWHLFKRTLPSAKTVFGGETLRQCFSEM